LFRVNSATFARSAHDCSIANLVFIHWPRPSVKVLAVENRLESCGVSTAKQFVRFIGRDFANKQISPADLPSVSLELNRAFWGHRQLAIVKVLHQSAVHGLLFIEPNPNPGSSHNDPEMVPFTKGFIRQDQGVLAWGSRAVVPKRP